MDQFEQHILTNNLRIAKETIKYINNRLEIMKGLTKDEAYFVTASAFRTYAFDEETWNQLKEHGEYMPPFLKDVKDASYKDVVKSFSDKNWKKANPNKEQEDKEKEEAERKAKEQDDGSIFEKEGDGHNSRSETHHGFAVSNVSMGGGKPITFHILPDMKLEESVLKLIEGEKFDAARNEVRGYILECLEGQLTSNDLALAQTPTDIKLNKPIQFNSVGISQTFHIKNQSLVDALSGVHLGLIITKKHMLDRKQEQEQLMEHFGHHLEKATEELVIDGDVKAAVHTLGSMSEEECKTAVEKDLHEVCDHFEKNPYTPAIDPTDLVGKEKTAPKKEEEAKTETETTQPANNMADAVQPADELTDQDKMEIATLGLNPKDFPNHTSMEEFRRSGEYEQIQSFFRSKALDDFDN